MPNIQIKDKEFALSIPEEEILKAVKEVGLAINRDLEGTNPLFICVLNGAFMFAGDLMKTINIPCEITFIKLSSYDGLYTSGTVKEIIGLNESVVGRNVVVVEDIVDTGITMERILSSLKAKGASDIHIATFLQKPDALQKDIDLPASLHSHQPTVSSLETFMKSMQEIKTALQQNVQEKFAYDKLMQELAYL